MIFDPSLGIHGNIERALTLIQRVNHALAIETTTRLISGAEHREAVEQTMTALYLDGIEAQQDITEIQLQLLEG